MTKRLVALLTLLAFTVAAAPANAVEPVNQAQKIAALNEGQRAPFQGILLSPAAFAEIRAQAASLVDLCTLDVDTALARQQALSDMRVAMLDSQLESERTRSTEIITIKDSNIAYLEKQLLQNSDPTYNEIWFASGIVAGALITIGIGFAIAEAQH